MEVKFKIILAKIWFNKICMKIFVFVYHISIKGIVISLKGFKTNKFDWFNLKVKIDSVFGRKNIL